MIKHILASCSLFVALTVCGLPVQAQNSAPAPAPAPAATKVSQDELKKFVGALKKIVVILQDMENEMVQAVKKEGLSEKRFTEILEAKNNPAAKPATQITPKEEQSYNQAIARLTQIEKDAQTRRDQAIQSEGLAVERFNQIYATIRKDPSLQQEVRKMIAQ